MLTEFQQKLHHLMVGLNTNDIHAKAHLCDEAIQMIKEETDDNRACGIRELICTHLLDLERYDDALECINGLKSSDDYRYNLSGYGDEAQLFLKKKDLHKKLQAEQKGLEICIGNNFREGIPTWYYMIGKTQYMMGQFESSIDNMSHCILYAQEVNNYNIIACSKYYIALCFEGMGRENIALEKLREASDDAWNQHSQSIIMHTEVARALKLMNLGDVNQAKEILTLWYNEFKFML